MLTNANVRTAIAETKAQRIERTKVTQDEVLVELARIAFSDMASYAKWTDLGVRMIASTELTEEHSRAVAEVSERKGEFGTSVRIKLYDKLQALKLLMPHLGMDTEKGQMRQTGSPVDVWRQYFKGFTDEQVAQMMALQEKFAAEETRA